MNVTAVKTKNYEQPTTNYELYKQTQFITTEGGSKPISKAKKLLRCLAGEFLRYKTDRDVQGWGIFSLEF